MASKRYSGASIGTYIPLELHERFDELEPRGEVLSDDLRDDLTQRDPKHTYLHLTLQTKHI